MHSLHVPISGLLLLLLLLCVPRAVVSIFPLQQLAFADTANANACMEKRALIPARRHNEHTRGEGGGSNGNHKIEAGGGAGGLQGSMPRMPPSLTRKWKACRDGEAACTRTEVRFCFFLVCVHMEKKEEKTACAAEAESDFGK